MAKNRQHRNRTGLTSDREKRPTNVRRARNQAFGIYRPLTEESKSQVTTVLESASPVVEKYLKGARRTKPIAELVLRSDFGVTFLPRIVVKKAIREFGLLERGFALGRMIDGVGQHNEGNQSKLVIPIDGFGWYADGKRGMVARLAASEGLQELFDQVPVIEDLLDEAKATVGLQVVKPNLVELFEYGQDGDHKDLDWYQRKKVSDIVTDHFRQVNVTALALGGLVLGDSFSQPRGVA